LAVDVPALEGIIDAFGGRVQLACEFRHASWHCDAVYNLMSGRDVALCLTDRRNRHGPLVRTASWGFVRMHEGVARPQPHYGSRALAAWVERVGDLWGPADDCFVYFNNDHGGWAIRDALTFAALARREGIRVHRASPARDAELTETGDGG
jgi:uncharacterized protein YecE (DUF72 family)